MFHLENIKKKCKCKSCGDIILLHNKTEYIVKGVSEYDVIKKTLIIKCLGCGALNRTSYNKKDDTKLIL